MAHVVEQVIGIKLSKLVRDSDTDTDLIDDTLVQELEKIVQELSPAGVIVEIIKN